MPGTTSIHSLRYPLISEAPDGPTQIGNLADDVDATLPYYGSSAPSSPVAGTMWVDADDGTCKIYSGSAWVDVTSDTGWISTGLAIASGLTSNSLAYRVQGDRVYWRGGVYGTAPAANGVIVSVPNAIQVPLRAVFTLQNASGAVAVAAIGNYAGTGTATSLLFKGMAAGSWSTTSVNTMDFAGVSWSLTA